MINLINLSFIDTIKKEVGDITSYFLPLYPLSILLYLFLCLSRLALKIVVMARQKARGKSEEGLGDFTFLYTVWFYCVHLLSFSVYSASPNYTDSSIYQAQKRLIRHH